MRIGIVGSRRRDSDDDYRAVLEQFVELHMPGDTIVSGGCPKGGDRFAEMIAKKYGIPITIYFPNWEAHGKAAGFMRNTSIAQNSDALIACIAEDRTGGTEDTIKKFLQSNDEQMLYLV